MITLEEIAGRLKDKTDYSFTVNRMSWEPQKVDNYVLPSFAIKESSAKGAETKLKNKLSKVLAFIDLVKHKRFKTGCTVMPISVTNKDNLAIWQNEKGVSRAIDFMIEIGLIRVESDKYQFGAYYEKDNKSKTYRYYKVNEDKLKEYCEDHDIQMFIVKNKVYNMSELKKLHTGIDKSKVRFASRLKLIKPIELSRAEFEKQLTLCLYDNYPALRFHIVKTNEINEKYYKDYPEFRIRFQPNFTWSEDELYVSGIGIRATNSLTNLKKENRKEVLKEYGFILEKDINASVPRMTLSLNSGHWIDESQDMYELIYRVIEPTGLFTKEKREAIKKLHMRAYFDSGDKSVGHHTWLTMEQNGIDREDVCDKMSEFRNAIIKAEGGKLYGSDIFYVESCVYLMTLYDLLSAGHKVWQVYDCFYSSGSDSQEWGQGADSEKLFTEMISKGVKLNFEYFLKTYWG